VHAHNNNDNDAAQHGSHSPAYRLTVTCNLALQGMSLILDIHVMINWYLSKQGIHWQSMTWPYCGLKFRAHWGHIFHSGFHRKAQVIKCKPLLVAKRGIMVPDVPCVDRGKNWGRKLDIACSSWKNAMFCEESFGNNRALYVHLTYMYKDIDHFRKGLVHELHHLKASQESKVHFQNVLVR